MAKLVVTEALVFTAADQLQAVGTEPTIILVQERIGGGSYTTIKRYLDAQYHQQKQLADTAFARVDDATFFAHLKEDGDDHTNSIAILVKHISGNFISCWTDFLTSDGEKADRQRPREFVHEPSDHRLQLMDRWEEGWRRLFATLESLTEDDFAKTVYIRDEAQSVVKAILRNLLHTTHHIGQIDLLATSLRNA